MALFPHNILTKWATPLNIAGLLAAYLSWKVSTSATLLSVILRSRRPFASLNDVILLSLPSSFMLSTCRLLELFLDLFLQS